MPRRRPSPAFALAAVALFAALGGPAWAGDLARSAQQRISGSRIAANSITGRQIRNDAIGLQDLSPVTRARLKRGNVPGNGSVTAAKIRNGAVTAPKIAAGSVRDSDLGTGAVTARAVADGSLGAADVARFAGSVALDFGPVAPGACAVLLSAGAAPDRADANISEDAVVVTPGSNWPAEALSVTAVNSSDDSKFRVVACNQTGAPADPPATNFRYLVIDVP